MSHHSVLFCVFQHLDVFPQQDWTVWSLHSNLSYRRQNPSHGSNRTLHNQMWTMHSVALYLIRLPSVQLLNLLPFIYYNTTVRDFLFHKITDLKRTRASFQSINVFMLTNTPFNVPIKHPRIFRHHQRQLYYWVLNGSAMFIYNRDMKYIFMYSSMHFLYTVYPSNTFLYTF